MNTKAKVLVVDDQAVNVQLLKRALERENISVKTASSGQETLDLVDLDPPDLILLDVMMPDMDGIEVCQRLQLDPAKKAIPIIFITARSSKEGKLIGLGAGAVDYITKPVDLDETVARVHTQLRLVSANREMLDLQRRLEESRRVAAVGAITSGIAHNLNNLLGIVLGYLDLIRLHADRAERVRANADNLDTAVQRIVAIIRQLTSLMAQSRLPSTPRPLNELLSGALLRFAQELPTASPVSLINDLGNLTIPTQVEMFEDSLVKLLFNAHESYGEVYSGLRPVRVRVTLKDSASGTKVLCVQVEDGGLGIKSAIRDQLFEPFISSKNTVGVGMGLTVARQSMRKLGGEITLADNSGGGATATLIHPLTDSPKSAN